MEDEKKENVRQIDQYKQDDFLKKKEVRDANESPASRWGDRVQNLIEQVNVLKLDADPAWDVYNHLDAVVDRLTEVSIYAESNEDVVDRPNWRQMEG